MDEIERIPSAQDVEAAYSEDQQDYSEHQYENAQDAQYDASQQFGSYPQSGAKDSIFTFFKHLLGIKDSSKVGNLDKRELGNLDLSVRNNEQLAHLGTLLHNRSFHDYFMGRAEIILATSMSKKGWFPELVVSQKKFTQRSVQPMTLQAEKKPFLGIGGKGSTVPQPQ